MSGSTAAPERARGRPSAYSAVTTPFTDAASRIQQLHQLSISLHRSLAPSSQLPSHIPPILPNEQRLTFPPHDMLSKLPHELLPIHPTICALAARRSTDVGDTALRVDGVHGLEEGEPTGEVERVGVQRCFRHSVKGGLGKKELSQGEEAGLRRGVRSPGWNRREFGIFVAFVLTGL